MHWAFWRPWAVAVLFSLPLWPQFEQIRERLGQLGKKTAVTEIAVKAHPADAKVRPFETLVIQVLAYGLDGEKKVRLRRTGAAVRLQQQESGWLSKPFSFQGREEEGFFEESASTAWNIFREASSEYVIKDCVLYTAPEKPGKYRLEAELEGKRAEFEVEVTTEAASTRKPEKITFPARDGSQEPYRSLAEHYAPFLAQETWFQPKSDMPSRFDFDGDWHGDNNWEALEEGSSQAYVYYAAVETETHWFLNYNVFHPRDYSDRCVIGTCHENDNEGIILTVRKDGSTFGRLQVMETLAHNNVYSFAADRSIRGGWHNVDGDIEFYQDSHPVVFIESGGHGIYGSRSSHSRFTLERGEFTEGTGITLVYKGAAERPRHASDRLVGYDLLPIYDEWWSRAAEGKGDARTFDDYFFYQPFGGRPALKFAIGGAFLGRKESSNKAKPFWGWHDSHTLKKGILAAGQWGLDPAYAVSQNLRFPAGQPFSLVYVYNPYLGFEGGTQTAAPAPAGPRSGQVEIAGQVDGTVEIYVSGGEMRWEVRSGQPVSRQTSRFSAPLPPVALDSCWVTKQDGRGSVTLVEKPSAANGFTARILVEDPRGGSDFYRLTFHWSR